MTASQISAGLSAPFGCVALLGEHGAIALLITLFMAVTSSSSSELIAVSSILTFDVYKMYIKPLATPSELIRVSHIMICIFGLIMAGFASLWNAIGIDLGWLFLVMGLIIGGAVFPAAFTVCWKGQTRLGAIGGALGGLAAGLIAWLTTAHVYFGELTVTTTGESFSTLAGNMAAVLTGLILTLTISLIKPDDFDWEITRSINKAIIIIDEKGEPGLDHSTPIVIHEDKEALEDAGTMEDPTKLRRAFKTAVILAVVLTLIMDFIIPIPMFLSHYIYSEKFFTFYIVVSFMWVFYALGACGILPIYEASGFFKDFFLALKAGPKSKENLIISASSPLESQRDLHVEKGDLTPLEK